MSEHVHKVTREHGETKGRFFIRKDGEEAELTYSITTPTLIIADHTGVPDSFRGTGAGLALAEALVAAARADGFKIIALCPFVKAQSLKHPEWADVFSR
ncbi:N-acetyltransferase [Xinfangfangia sp. CPCC 101601]|uniref:N-acetyltransferase n=1 Tax=Pseudogemmobacter lacusdianii TaxID=3069608 RepID=A0ABU0VT40_9RHOB|nr:GNAT family N-acetyltransferase [Xinfangfangia sp. CPCC 101601]MDQ2064895.1 N-acetyltransferase [Xinfangfangia sp. CPCC 101601]